MPRGKVDLDYLSARDAGPADLLDKPEDDTGSVDTDEALAALLLSDSEDDEEDEDEDLGEGEAGGSDETGDGPGAEPEANPEESD